MKAVLIGVIYCVCLVTCTRAQIDRSLIGRYAPTESSYSPKWLELLPDGRFVLTSGFDIPVPDGTGKSGNLIIEEGKWRPDGKQRLLLLVSKRKLASLYFVTVMPDTPRGPGLFVSSNREEPADWRRLDRFLSKEKPSQSPLPTRPTAGCP